MALNPFFLQGSPGEQNLMQSLIDEQLKIYGVEVTYIPRKVVNRSTVFNDLERSKFDDNFLLEAYVETWDGYGGQGDIMTKFGMTLKDELTLNISRERFEDFIAPFMEAMPDDEIVIDTRPREGDLIFFPLGNRLFEVKFVEHEDPFYQLGKNYTYKLQCELFEYEDEIIDTGVIGTGGVKKVFLDHDGSGYTSPPTITFSAPSSLPGSGTTATAVGVLTTRNNVTSLEYIYLTHAGVGYGNTAPIITISGGGGTGAAATCSLVPAGKKGLQSINITNHGIGFSTTPTVAISLPSLSPQLPATAHAVVGSGSSNPLGAIYILDAGAGFFSPPTVTIGAGATVGVGTYWFNEEVVGSLSNVAARVKRWDADTGVLQVGIQTGTFSYGERITGSKSGATYELSAPGTASTNTDYFRQNEDIEFDADSFLDFSESNPFGTF